MARALTSLARDKEKLSKDPSYGTIMPSSDEPVYPYGCCICLCNEELDKLGLDSDCSVGDELMAVVRFEVKMVSESKGPDGPNCRVELQIVAMDIVDPMDGVGSSRYKDNDSDDS